MACEHCLHHKMHCSHVGGIVMSTPTTDIVAWIAAVCNGVEVIAGTIDFQMQMFGALLNEVHRVWAAIDWLSASAASLLQAVVSTMDADEDDEGGATEDDGAESRDDEDGERVNIALMGLAQTWGRVSRPVCTAEAEMFMPPTDGRGGCVHYYSSPTPVISYE